MADAGAHLSVLRLPRCASRRLRRRAVRLRLRSQAPPSSDGDEGPPWRQGRQPRRDDERAQAAGARRLHDLHRRLPRLPGQRLAEGARRRDRQAGQRPREEDGPPPRRLRRPAARQRALGRQVLDARDDGHRPQPRPQRQERQGSRRRRRTTSASPTTRTAASSRCTGASSSTSTGRCSSTPSRRPRQAAGVTNDADLPAGALKELCSHVQGGRQGGDRQAVPAGPDQAAARRRRGRVQQLERRPGDRLPRS